jgi:hypothetical protein
MDFKDLMDGYESISRDFPLPQYAISILHGKWNLRKRRGDETILWWKNEYYGG